MMVSAAAAGGGDAEALDRLLLTLALPLRGELDGSRRLMAERRSAARR